MATRFKDEKFIIYPDSLSIVITDLKNHKFNDYVEKLIKDLEKILNTDRYSTSINFSTKKHSKHIILGTGGWLNISNDFSAFENDHVDENSILTPLIIENGELSCIISKKSYLVEDKVDIIEKELNK